MLHAIVHYVNGTSVKLKVTSIQVAREYLLGPGVIRIDIDI